MRYRLQRKEPITRNYVIGNKIYPYPTFRWIDIYVPDSKEALEKIKPENDDYRIEDTRPFG
jgi:hypothetical protein